MDHIKPKLKEGSEPISSLHNQLATESDSMLLVVAVTKKFEVRCFVSEEAPNVVKRTLGPEEELLFPCNCLGFPCPCSLCLVCAAVGRAAASSISDITQGLIADLNAEKQRARAAGCEPSRSQ